MDGQGETITEVTSETITITTERVTVDPIGISDESANIFTWVVIVGLCQAVDILGVVTNIINIRCFVKQGFSEPVNISLLGLTISDLGCLVTQMCINTFYTLIVGGSSYNFVLLDVLYLVVVNPHLAFSRVSSWITAIITLERCLCITVPLKIKNIVTTKRIWILISGVYITFLLSGVPVYAVNSLKMIFDPARNTTLLGMVGTVDKHQVEGITFSINSFLLPIVAFMIITICTIILVVNLRNRSKWRETAIQTDLSTREQKVAKMVVMISVLFIVCFVPISANMFAIAFEPRLNVGGKYVNITTVSGNVGLLLQAINSSSNIFIYYHMSKKYRDTFQTLFHISKDGSK